MRLILCPLKKELTSLVDFFQAQGLSLEKKQDQGRWSWQCPTLNLALAVGGHGKAQFGIQSQFWLQKFAKIDHLFCLGAGGALHPHVQLLDVVVATDIIEHDHKFIFGGENPKPTYQTAAPLIQYCQTMKPEQFKVHLGAIASGDEDIVSASRARELYAQTKALAVAWEGAGGARAAAFNRIPYSEIRGITDDASHEVANHFHNNLSQAIQRCGEVLLSYFKGSPSI